MVEQWSELLPRALSTSNSDPVRENVSSSLDARWW